MSSHSRLLGIGAAALVALSLTCTAALGKTGSADRLAATRSVSSVPHVLGYGHQVVTTAKGLFGLFAAGSGKPASGTMSFYVGKKLIAGKVKCLVINGNDAIVTGKATIGGVSQVVVAELVDVSAPHDRASPDLLRFSFTPAITPDPANAGCYLPMLPPLAILTGDISVASGS